MRVTNQGCPFAIAVQIIRLQLTQHILLPSQKKVWSSSQQVQSSSQQVQSVLQNNFFLSVGLSVLSPLARRGGVRVAIETNCNLTVYLQSVNSKGIIPCIQYRVECIIIYYRFFPFLSFIFSTNNRALFAAKNKAREEASKRQASKQQLKGTPRTQQLRKQRLVNNVIELLISTINRP